MTLPHTRIVGGWLASAVAGLGLWALIAWRADHWQLAAWMHDAVPMAPVTAALFVLLGAVLARRCFEATIRPVTIRLLGGGAVITTLVCLLELTRGWHGRSLPWQGWLLREDAYIAAIPLAQMSPLTAVAFLLVAAVFALKASGGEHYAPPVAVGLAGAGSLLGLLVVLGYITGSPLGYGDSTVPMALPTALGFVLLNGALLCTGRLWTWLRERFTIAGLEEESRLLALRLGLITAGLMLLLGMTGFFFIRSEMTDARERAYAAIEAVARLKTEQVRQWWQERNAEAQFLMHTRAVAEDVDRMLAWPDDETAKAKVTDWLSTIQAGDRYEAVMVFDATGRTRLALPASAARDTTITPAAIAETLAGGRILRLPLHHAGEGQSLRLKLLVPVPDPVRRERFTAVITLRLNPEQQLFPLLRHWPLPSETGEFLLVRREGNEVVFVNDLRHLPVGPLAHRVSLFNRELPAVRLVMGETGTIEGRDYRGTPVLAAGHAIAGTPWYLLAKIDLAEVFSPVRRDFWQNSLLLILLLLGVLGGVLFYWRQRHATILRRSLIAERQSNEFAQRLTLLLGQVNDIVLLLDDKWRIVEANQRAIETYGYSLEELRALPPGGLRPADELARHPEHMEQFFSAAGARFETVQLRKDGTRLPVEVSGGAVELDGRRHVLALYRDLTERKAHEAERERLTRLYATLSQVNQAIVHAVDRAVLLQQVCRVLVEFGSFRMAWIGARDEASAQIKPLVSAGDDAGYLKTVCIFADERPEGQGPTGRAHRLRVTQVCQDVMAEPRVAPWREAMQRSGFRSSIALPVLRGGKVDCVLTAYAAEPDFFGRKEIALLEEAAQDVAFALENLQRDEQRRQMETELEASELRFRTLFDHAPVGISLTTEGKLVLVNAEHARITGVPVAASFEPGVFGRVSHPEDYARQLELAAKFHRGEVGSYSVEKRYLHPDGRVQWAELTSHQYVDPATQRRVIVTIISDIAERKAYEERVQRQLDELRRWHEVTLGREERVMDLKREVNALLAKAGAPPRYSRTETDPSAADRPEEDKPA